MPPPPIEVINRQRMHQIERNRAAALARAVLDAIGEKTATLNIIFLRDRQMRVLNRTWRGIDRSTDVLSFAYHEETDDQPGQLGQPGQEFPAFPGDDLEHNLGDLVISVETAARYATEYGISFAREIDHLVIHGTLHLAGYDHETDNGRMNRLEKRLRQRLLSEDGGADSTLRP